jgi:hypothetical protein
MRELTDENRARLVEIRERLRKDPNAHPANRDELDEVLTLLGFQDPLDAPSPVNPRAIPYPGVSLLMDMAERDRVNAAKT